MHWNMGDVPEWVGSAGTVLVFLLGLGVYRADRRERHREIREQDARRFDAWVYVVHTSAATPDSHKVRFAIWCSNSTEQAMRSVGVDFFSSSPAAVIGFADIGTVAPTAAGAPAHYEFEFVLPFGFAVDDAGYDAYIVCFTDPARRRWCRDGGGNLWSPDETERARRSLREWLGEIPAR